MPSSRSSLFATTGVAKPKTPTSLRVEDLENALGIDEKQPRLSNRRGSGSAAHHENPED
jgi:hypothetical protein